MSTRILTKRNGVSRPTSFFSFVRENNSSRFDQTRPNRNLCPRIDGDSDNYRNIDLVSMIPRANIIRLRRCVIYRRSLLLRTRPASLIENPRKEPTRVDRVQYTTICRALIIWSHQHYSATNGTHVWSMVMGKRRMRRSIGRKNAKSS